MARRALLQLLALALGLWQPASAAPALVSGACNASAFVRDTSTNKLAPVLRQLHVATPATCCAACSREPGCAVWTLNENDHPTKCGLKGELTGSLKVGAKAGCTTGVLHALPPTPPAPPSRNPTLQLIYIRQT